MNVSVADVEEAANRIAGQAAATPYIENEALNHFVGGRLILKPECLQRTGSFKFRGAFNRLSALSEQERGRGVVAWSSGNHAQGVAAAAQILGINAAIVMPADAPAVKLERTRASGAEIITYDRYTESREEIGRALAERRGAVLVPSYDDPHIIAGQGTVGLELVRECEVQGIKLDSLLVCCSGGGLVAGTSLAFEAFSPETKIFAVEPADFDDHARSLEAGKRVKVSPDARSICDALLAPEPGELTFSINQRTLSGGVSVTDDEVRAAMRFAFSELKLVLEPGGAVALAAALHHRVPTGGHVVGVVLSGGNVEPALFARVLAGEV